MCKGYAQTKRMIYTLEDKTMNYFHTECRETEQKNPHPYLVRGHTADHVVRAVQRVGQGVFVRCFMQLLNYTCGRKTEKHAQLQKAGSINDIVKSP